MRGGNAVSERDLLQGLPPFLFATAVPVSFALAVYLALYDRKGASAILAAAALAAALLAYLPQLDSLSAFAVNVKLRSNLDRADEILAKLRKLTVVNAKLAYTTLAWEIVLERQKRLINNEFSTRWTTKSPLWTWTTTSALKSDDRTSAL